MSAAIEASSVLALGDEPGGCAQDVALGAEHRQRGVGAGEQIANALLGALDAELGDEGGLAEGRILAGDALLTIAFDIITRDEIHREPGVRLALTRALARAAGIGGMVGGQILDLAGEGRFGDREPVNVARLQQMKTGALLRFGCIAGAILGQSSAKEYQALDDFGRALGEAFQIADDLLDIEGDASALGKPAGQDAALGKTTFVTQLGIAGARQRVRDLLGRADSALSIFGAKGEVLRAAARFVAERKN